MNLPEWLRDEIETTNQTWNLQEARIVEETDPEKMAIVPSDNGKKGFVKWNEDGKPGIFEAEAKGLRTLRDAAAGIEDLYVPEVLGYGERWLMMEDVEGGSKRQSASALGRGMATLHKIEQDHYGFGEDTYIGTLLQPNAWSDSWVDFYREYRLTPMATTLEEQGHMPPERRARLDSIMARLDEWLTVDGMHPSLVHGDLWSVNWMAAHGGRAVLVDPAVCHAHREVDLAMMHQFGSPPEAFWGAYEEVYPTSDGCEERRPLYQLYYLMAHTALTQDYTSQIDEILNHYAN